YSIPHTFVQRMVTVRATPQRVRILEGAATIADHARSYDRGAQIEDQDHIETLVSHKRKAREHRGANRLTRAVPASSELLLRAAARGSALGAITTSLLRLLDRYGVTELQAAIEETLNSGAPHPHSVRVVLERRREARHAPPPITVGFSDHVRAKDAAVAPQRLDRYDALMEAKHDNDF
ncbi:MAG: Mu transposase domain-containing protein, partial [Candidatus Binataceae bacterium]